MCVIRKILLKIYQSMIKGKKSKQCYLSNKIYKEILPPVLCFIQETEFFKYEFPDINISFVSNLLHN